MVTGFLYPLLTVLLNSSIYQIPFNSEVKIQNKQNMTFFYVRHYNTNKQSSKSQKGDP